MPTKEEEQNKTICKLYKDLLDYSDKANRKDYVATLYERKTIEYISAVVEGIKRNI